MLFALDPIAGGVAGALVAIVGYFLVYVRGVEERAASRIDAAYEARIRTLETQLHRTQEREQALTLRVVELEAIIAHRGLRHE